MDCVQITNIFVKHWEMKERKILEILPLELAGLMVAGKKKVISFRRRRGWESYPFHQEARLVSVGTFRNQYRFCFVFEL